MSKALTVKGRVITKAEEREAWRRVRELGEQARAVPVSAIRAAVHAVVRHPAGSRTVTCRLLQRWRQAGRIRLAGQHKLSGWRLTPNQRTTP